MLQDSHKDVAEVESSQKQATSLHVQVHTFK